MRLINLHTFFPSDSFDWRHYYVSVLPHLYFFSPPLQISGVTSTFVKSSVGYSTKCNAALARFGNDTTHLPSVPAEPNSRRVYRLGNPGGGGGVSQIDPALRIYSGFSQFQFYDRELGRDIESSHPKSDIRRGRAVEYGKGRTWCF